MRATIKIMCHQAVNWLTASATGRFCFGVVLTFCVSLLYPLSLTLSFDLVQALEILRQCPNYSIFYPFIFPLVVGLIFSGIDIEGFKVKRNLLSLTVILSLLAVFALAVVSNDALDKGPPLQPESFIYANSNLWSQAFNETQKDRTECLQQALTNRPVFLYAYITNMAAITGSNTNQIMKFKNFSDYKRRASWPTYLDLLASGYAGLMGALLFGYFIFIRLVLTGFSKAHLNNLILALILFSTWFPCRVYSLWYENFGSLENCGGSSIIVVGFAAVVCSIVATVIFKPDKVVVIGSAVQTVLISIIGIVAKFQPEVFGQTGFKTVESIDGVYFAAILFALFLGLFAILWPFVKKCDSPKPGGN